jgi:hypothetical protein
MKRLIAVVTAVAFGNSLAASFVVDGNLAAIATATIATITLTLAVVNWIDKRIDHKIKNYSATVRVQHFVVLRELSSLRELMGHPPLNIPEILKDEKDQTA